VIPQAEAIPESAPCAVAEDHLPVLKVDAAMVVEPGLHGVVTGRVDAEERHRRAVG
jgi:hypothetical protein